MSSSVFRNSVRIIRESRQGGSSLVRVPMRLVFPAEQRAVVRARSVACKINARKGRNGVDYFRGNGTWVVPGRSGFPKWCQPCDDGESILTRSLQPTYYPYDYSTVNENREWFDGSSRQEEARTRLNSAFFGKTFLKVNAGRQVRCGSSLDH